MTWQISYTINDNLKQAISNICDKKLKDMPDKQEAWNRKSDITLDSYTWSFYRAEGLKEVKEQLKIITGLNTFYEHGYSCIWRYDESFPKCPIHIDDEAQHKGSLCISLSGYHNIFLHDTETKEKLEMITVKNNDIMFIRNSEYYHSVEGNGDLLVLGVEARAGIKYNYKVIEQAFTQSQLDQFVVYWENNTDKIYHTNGMDKIQDPWDLPIVKEIVKPVLDKHFDTSLKNLGDNLYRHSSPYYPHVDISKNIYPCFNVLIPIAQQTPVEQHFIIYDQWVNQPIGATWLGEWYSKQTEEFDNNKKREYPLGDSVVEGIKGDQVLEHLTIQGKERALFKGLSGVALDFEPGNIIVFDSKHIHATGSMSGGWKMGLTLRFAGNYYEHF